jgi:hypothetical protein
MSVKKPIILPVMKVGHINPIADYAMPTDSSDDEELCYELPSAEAWFEKISFESSSYETSYKKPEQPKLKKQKPKKKLIFDDYPIKTLEIIRPQL